MDRIYSRGRRPPPQSARHPRFMADEVGAEVSRWQRPAALRDPRVPPQRRELSTVARRPHAGRREASATRSSMSIRTGSTYARSRAGLKMTRTGAAGLVGARRSTVLATSGLTHPSVSGSSSMSTPTASSRSTSLAGAQANRPSMYPVRAARCGSRMTPIRSHRARRAAQTRPRERMRQADGRWHVTRASQNGHRRASAPNDEPPISRSSRFPANNA
jgi:hypothetical protein